MAENQTRLSSFDNCQLAKMVRGSSTEVEHFDQSLKIKGSMPIVGTVWQKMTENCKGKKPDQAEQFW